jgi:threonine dehydrogenase-like Zn-dependent dehydrogenase
MVAVLGVGGVGAFLVHAAVAMGADVVAVDLDADRLRIAEALGASRTVRADPDEPLAAQVAAAAGPFTVVYEVTGVASVLIAGFELVEPRGRIVAIGLGNQPIPLDVRGLTLSELRLVGTNAHDFADAARLVAARTAGWANVAPMALPLDQLVDHGLRPMAERTSGRVKTLIDPWATEVRIR